MFTSIRVTDPYMKPQFMLTLKLEMHQKPLARSWIKGVGTRKGVGQWRIQGEDMRPSPFSDPRASEHFMLLRDAN